MLSASLNPPGMFGRWVGLGELTGGKEWVVFRAYCSKIVKCAVFGPVRAFCVCLATLVPIYYFVYLVAYPNSPPVCISLLLLVLYY